MDPDSVIGTKEPRQSLLPAGWEYAYAYVFFIAVFLGQTVRFFVGSEPLLGAQPAQILIPLVALLISAPLWLASPIPIRLPSGLLALFFGLLIFIWLWALIRDWGATDLTAFTLGPFLAMLATKTPTPACALRVLNTLGVLVLVLFASAAVFAVITDAPATGFTTKWPPLTDPFDPIGMWWAPFNGPAESGALGAVLVLLGLSQRGSLRIAFVFGGAVILFYGGTLAAALGLAVGIVVLLLAFAQLSPRKRAVEVVTVLLAGLGIFVLAREVVTNPTLSSRTYIWSDFLALLRKNPIWGWGSQVLIESEKTRKFPTGEDRVAHGSDAHNVLLDAWVRYGFIFMMGTAAVLVVTVVIASRAWRFGMPIGLALISFVVAMGLTESNIWWGTPSTILTIFILAVLSGGGADKRRNSKGGKTDVEKSLNR